MRATLEMYIEQEEWKFAAIAAGNLSELELTLGEVSAAIADPAQSVTFADDSGDWGQQMSKRTTHADALHQAGRRDEARQLFAEAEALQAERQPSYPRLYSVQGFRYCDLLLSDAERAAWRQVVAALRDAASSDGSPEEPRRGASGPLSDCDAVTERAAQTLEWMTSDPHAPILTIAVDHLTLSRAELYRALCSQSKSANQKSKIHAPLTAAVDGLREAGAMNHLPKSLLTRAWHRQLTGNAAGAASDLNEAWEIAERGPMPLYQADILLTRARLFGTTKFLSEVEGRKEDGYPWGSPQEDLAEARRLIEEHGYHRRDGELEDAEAALGTVGERED